MPTAYCSHEKPEQNREHSPKPELAPYLKHEAMELMETREMKEAYLDYAIFSLS